MATFTNIANTILAIFARFDFLDWIGIIMVVAKLADFRAFGADIVPTSYIRIPIATTQERETALISLGESNQLPKAEVPHDSDDDWVYDE